MCAHILKSLEDYSRVGTWAPPDQLSLEVGKLVAMSAVFCPPDLESEVPLNAVLKTTFG
jgi:hypothetical protein